MSRTKRSKPGSSRSKSAYFQNKRRKHEVSSLEVGMVGFLVSATLRKEKDAATFITQHLMDILETHYADILEKCFPTSTFSEDIDKAIEEEVKDRQTKPSPILLVPNLANCLFFVQLHPSLLPHLDPRSLIPHLFEVHPSAARFIHRILPVSTICKASVDSIVTALEQLMTLLPSDEKGSYRIALNSRFNHECNKDEVISKTASLFLNKNHRTDLTNPDITVVVEIMGKFVGLSILTQGLFTKYHKLNIQEHLAKKIKATQKDKETKTLTNDTSVVAEEEAKSYDQSVDEVKKDVSVADEVNNLENETKVSEVEVITEPSSVDSCTTSEETAEPANSITEKNSTVDSALAN